MVRPFVLRRLLHLERHVGVGARGQRRRLGTLPVSHKLGLCAILAFVRTYVPWVFRQEMQLVFNSNPVEPAQLFGCQ